MSSRLKILAAVKANQPEATVLPKDLTFEAVSRDAVVDKFIEVLTLIGGVVIKIDSISAIEDYIQSNYRPDQRVVSPIAALSCYTLLDADQDPHELEDIAFAVCQSNFAVAENGAVWVTEDLMGARVLPFITQHLALVVEASKMIPHLHEAYQLINASPSYGFGAFIAGPSKTADIEQSLVLGAHGARSLVVFLLP